MKKEYLAKVNGIYRIVEDHEVVSGRIEIPEDADCLVGYNQKLEDGDWSTHWFGKIKNGLVNEIHEDHESSYHNTVEGLVERGQMLWQRQPENQNPLDGVKWLEGDLKEAKLDKQLSKVDLTLLERQSQYGCFEDVAFVTQGIIALLRKCNYDNMPQPHQMALYMIASKMARLVNGDHNHLDSWHDIGGYSKLIENLIGGENE